jgi:hypothetical protein
MWAAVVLRVLIFIIPVYIVYRGIVACLAYRSQLADRCGPVASTPRSVSSAVQLPVCLRIHMHPRSGGREGGLAQQMDMLFTHVWTGCCTGNMLLKKKGRTGGRRLQLWCDVVLWPGQPHGNLQQGGAAPAKLWQPGGKWLLLGS